MTDERVDDPVAAPTIVFDHVSKRYRATDPSRRSRGGVGLAGVAEESDDDDIDEEEDAQDEPAHVSTRDIWALDDVSLTVSAGASLGVLGPDGSGKTTLLKVLARITPPTSGEITVRGRVAPMIGVATSFMQQHESGARYVRLLGRLFGVPRSVVDQRLPEIFAFAELEGRENVPLKRYSSGLSRRLAFSTVLNLDPDVLLADDVLVVGDSSFQQRCIVKIHEELQRGLTLVLATHDQELVQQLCSEVVWMEGGRIVETGATRDVVSRRYPSTLLSQTGGRTTARGRWKRSFNQFAALHAGAIRSSEGYAVDSVNIDEVSVVQILLEVAEPGVYVACIVKLFLDGELYARFAQPEPFAADVAGSYVVTARLPAGLLGEGSYTGRLSAFVSVGGSDHPIVRGDAFAFDAFSDPDRIETGADEEQSDELPEIDWSVERQTSLILEPRASATIVADAEDQTLRTS